MRPFLTAALLILAIPALPQAVFTVQVNDTLQKIHNIGASACWFGEEIGRSWPREQKQRVAELLFSRELDKKGHPKGIGLSAFRFNIGAGTAEQGDSSGIPDPAHRTECFLSPDGTWHWEKQPGYTWLLRQAKRYGIPDLIAFVNSPPVQFTKNGLGYKLEKDYTTNLKSDKYKEYGDFLATVLQHFEQAGLPFRYISPVNEPQWDWSGVFGKSKQEGSPWSNQDIYQAVTALDASLGKTHLNTRILMPEAAQLDYLYAQKGHAAHQIAAFRDPASPLYIGNLSHVAPFMAGHSYFTDNGDQQLINVRANVRDTARQYQVEFWQSEYCMLGNGFREGNRGRRSALDCALFLAKVIHHDLTVANASAWHYWNSFEPGSADSNTLYYLIALDRHRLINTTNQPINQSTNQLYTVTKNLWALGHYSRFIRPGMYRVAVSRADGLAEQQAAQNIMISAFRDIPGKQIVVNVINYTSTEQDVQIDVPGMKLKKRYDTWSDGDMEPVVVKGKLVLKSRSISTLVFEGSR